MSDENALDDNGGHQPDDDDKPRRSRNDNDADNVSVCITAGISIFLCLVILGGTYLI
jgi:hypothetical protein